LISNAKAVLIFDVRFSLRTIAMDYELMMLKGYVDMFFLLENVNDI